MATRLTIQPRPLRELLREAGAAPHARLDATFAACAASVSDYTRLLQTLEGFHSSADVLLASWVARSADAPVVLIPRRAGALKRDLRHLGASTLAPLDLSELPRDPVTGLLTDGAGLALLYVTAGSSIGARVILTRLSHGIPADARTGLREGASPASARLWRTTVQALSAVSGSIVTADAERSCTLVFEALCASFEDATAPAGR